MADVTRVLTEREVGKRELNLAGYASRKNNKFQIMFNKEVALA